MKKPVIFGILGVLVAIGLFQAVDAYTYGIDSYHEPYYSYHYDPYYNVGGVCYSFNDRGCNHNYPGYRYRHIEGWNFDRDDDHEWDYEIWRAANWIDDSFQARYDVSRGRASGEVFGGTSEPALSSTNWRYKEAYDPYTHGSGDGRNYYYRAGIDPELGYVNWRY